MVQTSRCKEVELTTNLPRQGKEDKLFFPPSYIKV